MLRYLKYVFPAGSPNAIALTQDMQAGKNVLLNGVLASSDGTVDFLKHGYTRQISLTSVNNLSGENFVITGTQNNVVITETLAGPNTDTVYSTEVFDTITSITVSADVDGVRVGTGWRGYFKIIQIDMLKSFVCYSLTLSSSTTTNQVPIAIYSTLDNIVNSSPAINNNPLILSNSIYDDEFLSSTVFIVKGTEQVTQYSLQYPYTDLANSTTGGAPAVPLLAKYLLIGLGSNAVNEASINSAMTLIFTQL